MEIELDQSALLPGERFSFTSGTSKLKGTFEDMNKIFSPKNEESLPDLSCKHENLGKPMSNCCGYEVSGLDIDYQTCPSCKEHCSLEYECEDCGTIITK